MGVEGEGAGGGGVLRSKEREVLLNSVISGAQIFTGYHV